MHKKLFTGFFLLLFAFFHVTLTAFATPMEVVVSIPPQKWVSDKVGGTLVPPCLALTPEPKERLEIMTHKIKAAFSAR